jgi:hypothetical protein
MAFIIGFSLDDLAILRFPGYLFGIMLGIVVFAFGPAVWGLHIAKASVRIDENTFVATCGMRRRIGLVFVLAVGLVTVAWFAIFAEGVPAWAAS